MTEPRPRRTTRLAGRMARNPRVSRFLQKVAPRADKFLHRVSGGRFHVAALAVPTLILGHVGRKTGIERVTPLLYVPYGRGFLVVGSNWAQANHPAWTENLLARPETYIEVKRHRWPVKARLLEGAEREAAWATLTQWWPTYETYQERAANRVLRVFFLEPTGDPMRLRPPLRERIRARRAARRAGYPDDRA